MIYIIPISGDGRKKPGKVHMRKNEIMCEASCCRTARGKVPPSPAFFAGERVKPWKKVFKWSKLEEKARFIIIVCQQRNVMNFSFCAVETI